MSWRPDCSVCLWTYARLMLRTAPLWTRQQGPVCSGVILWDCWRLN